MAEDIAQWLDGLGLGQYAPAFAENDIDLEILPHLMDEDLERLGLSLGHMRKLQVAIKALSADEPPTRPVPPPSKEPEPQPAEAERRQLTVMFVDVVGSTALSGELDPEDYREVLRAYQDACAGVVARYEGHVAKLLGDGTLIYFGYPQAHEDDAERAVRAGLGVVEAVSALTPRTGVSLRVRIGIATGLVVVGDMVGEGVTEQDAISGETPNLAARLQALAAPGTVVVSETTRGLVERVFEWEDLGAHDLKGFAHPVAAWRAVGEGAFESRFEAVRAGHLTSFVGREQELGLLEERWIQAKEGEGQVVQLSGEAGIGKSRITRVLLDRLVREPHVRLRYQCSPHHVNTAFYPFISQLERAASFSAGDDDDIRLDKLEALLRRGSDDIADSVPRLAVLLSIGTGDRYPALEIAPQAHKQQTQKALLDQLSGLAERQPVLVMFEDLHWADPTTLEVLEQMVDRIQEWPVLAIVTYRPEFQPPWIGRTHTTTLTLNRLSRRQGAAIVADLTDGKPVPRAVLDQILEKTDGVPLFVEELTKTVLESGLLEEWDDRYVLSGPLPTLAIPSTLHDSLIARLDHLAPVKEMAQTGAVIGREFSYRLLAAVSDSSGAELERALDQLIESELVFRRGSPPDATYVFKHALVRDAAYESLLISNRQAIHGRIFDALEQNFPQLVDADPELLAQHATHAGLVSKAVDYWLRAGKRAASQSANTEAVSHLRNGLELLARLAEGDERDRQELSYLISLGPALMATVGWDAEEVDETYSRARRLAAKTAQPAILFPSIWGLWLVAHAGGAAERARERLKELVDLAVAEDDETMLLQARHAGGSNMCTDGMLHEALQQVEEGVTLYRRGDHSDQALRYGGHDPCVCAQSLGALTQLMLGHFHAAESYSQDAMKLAETVEHQPSVAHAYLYRAELCHLRGEPQEAGERARTVLEIAEPYGLAHYAAWARIHIGWSRARQGEIEAGMEDVERGIENLKEVGIRYHLAQRFAVWAETLAVKGAIEEAVRAADECMTAVTETGERWFEAEALRLKARMALLADADGLDAVASLLERAVAVADAQDAKFWKLRASTPLARLMRDRGRDVEARDLLAPIYGAFTEGFDTPDLKDTKALLDELS